MKFLVISDIHANGAAAGWTNERIAETGADAVLVLGDITHFGPVQWAIDFLKSIEAPCFVIPGNCDPLDLPSSIAAVATDMHGKSCRQEGFTLVGLGGSNPTIFNTPFELSEEEIMERLRPISEEGMLLMTHTPPYGTNDEIPSGINVGSSSLAEIIREFKPIAVLTGHVHEARAMVEKDGILYMNPGPAKDGFAGVLEVDSGGVSAELLESKIL